MYYRVYRRRQYIYVFLAFLFLLYLFYGSSDKKSASSSRSELGERRNKASGRITMDTYVPPKNCDGCPGEYL